MGRIAVSQADPHVVPSAPAAPRGARIEHRIEIETPAETIWALLRDVDGWSRWNPLYVEASGSIGVGDTIAIAVVLPGMKPQRTRATVLAAVPNTLLRYRTVGLGGLLWGIRYVEIEQVSPAHCIVLNGELMGGLLGPILARTLGGRVRQGLQLMNEALKPVAETQWRGR